MWSLFLHQKRPLLIIIGAKKYDLGRLNPKKETFVSPQPSPNNADSAPVLCEYYYQTSLFWAGLTLRMSKNKTPGRPWSIFEVKIWFWDLGSSYIETTRFKSPGHKYWVCLLRNTLLYRKKEIKNALKGLGAPDVNGGSKGNRTLGQMQDSPN